MCNAITMQTTSNQSKKRIFQGLGALALVLMVILPAISFASQRAQLYVDANVSNSGNGSIGSPYKTISQALKNAPKKAQVHVAKGFYKENISIPEGVELFGADRAGVILTAADSDEPTVVMNHKTKIDKFTIRNGEYGIRVNKNAKVSILESTVEYSKHEGIRIKEGDVDEDHRVNISDTIIRRNSRSGIFADNRRVVVMDSDILENGTDGINFHSGVSAWIEGNEIKNNSGSGLALVLDGADIWMKNNTVRGNDHQGMEVNAYGGWGKIDVRKTRFIGNDHYAIAKVAREAFSRNVWSGLTIQNTVSFWNNKRNVSDILSIR